MDSKRFDSLTRAMATGKSRRDVLKLIAGGAAASGLAVVKLDDASAQQCAWGACTTSDDCDDPVYPECDGQCCQVAMTDTATTAPPASADETGGTTTSGETVTTVTNTGVGPDGAASGAWMGAALAGGAAALFASKVLRRNREETEDSV
jgi:hypothetical protein